MKMLDEVIKGVEAYAKLFEEKGCFECHYREDDCVKSCFLQDELRYLKEYKKYNDTMCALPDYYEWVHSADNPPLTWDELRTMEGKPVWIELGLLRPRWYLIEGIKGDQMVGVDALSVRVPFYKDGTYTGGWNAYRKERQ